MYSAKKIAGKKLYQLARKGVAVEREAKPVRVHKLALVACRGADVTLDVTCSAGTYVRVLAQDIGEHLGCGAHLVALRRTAAGPFSLSQAIALQALIDAPDMLPGCVLPLRHALAGLSRIDVSREVGRMLMRGYQLNVADLRAVELPPFAANDALAIGMAGGDLIAVTRAELASEDLPLARRERRALTTERILQVR